MIGTDHSVPEPTPSTEESLAKAKPKFKLQWWAFLAAILALIVIAAALVKDGVAIDYRFAATVGGAWVRWLILGGVVGVVAYFATGRSSSAFNGLFVAVVAGGVVFEAMRPTGGVRASKATQGAVADSGGASEMPEAERKRDPDEACRSAFQMFDRFVGMDREEFANAMARFNKEPLESPLSTDGAWFEGRLLEVKDLERLAGIGLQRVEGKWDPLYRILDWHAPRAKNPNYKAEFKVHVEKHIQMARDHHSMIVALQEYHGFLDTHRGEWQFDAANKSYRFEKPELSSQWRAVVERLGPWRDKFAVPDRR